MQLFWLAPYVAVCIFSPSSLFLSRKETRTNRAGSANGRGELYAYLPPSESNTRRLLAIPGSYENPDYGFSVGRGSFSFHADVWTTVAERVKLNDVGQKNGEWSTTLARRKTLLHLFFFLLTQNTTQSKIQNTRWNWSLDWWQVGHQSNRPRFAQFHSVGDSGFTFPDLLLWQVGALLDRKFILANVQYVLCQDRPLIGHLLKSNVLGSRTSPVPLWNDSLWSIQISNRCVENQDE